MTTPPTELFDTSPYTSLPHLDSVRLLALGRRIVAQAPGQLTADQHTALGAVRDATQTLRDAVTPRLRAGSQGAARKKADNNVDTAWAALQLRVLAASYRDESRYPLAARAKTLLKQMFPGGLSFLTLEYEAEWGESEKLVALIDQEKLGPLLDELAGPGYLDDVRHFHQIYGDVLGMNAALPAQEASINLAEPMNALRLALTVYVRRLIASLDETRPETVEAFQNALSPILEARPVRAVPATPDPAAVPAPDPKPPTPTKPA